MCSIRVVGDRGLQGIGDLGVHFDWKPPKKFLVGCNEPRVLTWKPRSRSSRGVTSREKVWTPSFRLGLLHLQMPRGHAQRLAPSCVVCVCIVSGSSDSSEPYITLMATHGCRVMLMQRLETIESQEKLRDMLQESMNGVCQARQSLRGLGSGAMPDQVAMILQRAARFI